MITIVLIVLGFILLLAGFTIYQTCKELQKDVFIGSFKVLQEKSTGVKTNYVFRIEEKRLVLVEMKNEVVVTEDSVKAVPVEDIEKYIITSSLMKISDEMRKKGFVYVEKHPRIGMYGLPETVYSVKIMVINSNEFYKIDE